MMVDESKLTDQNSTDTGHGKNDPLLVSDKNSSGRRNTASIPNYEERGRRLPQHPQQRRRLQNGIFQSTCNDPSMIPEIAKDWKWYDPHFNITDSSGNNIDNNIIAVFDMDHEVVNRYSQRGYIIYVYIYILSIHLYVTLSEIVRHFPSPPTVSEVLNLLLFSLVLVLNHVQSEVGKKFARYHFIHIAIATDGIYIDERNTKNLARYDRTIIPFETISECYVHLHRYRLNTYEHVAFVDANGDLINSLLNCMCNIHSLVDIVNAMMIKKSLSINTMVSIFHPSPMEQNDSNDIETAGTSSIV